MSRSRPSAAIKQHFILSDSDDTIATDSTGSSEPQDQYSVERILAEKWDPKKKIREYLIKWEGYPLHRATYEPTRHLHTNDILNAWKKTKQRIAAGLEEPFNVEKWEEACNVALEQSKDRKRRRQLKRAKRRKQARHQSEDEHVPTPSSSRRATQQISARKGVARKIDRKKSTHLAPDTESDGLDASEEEDGAGSEPGSRYEEVREHVPPRPDESSPKSPRAKGAAKESSDLREKPANPTHARKSAPSSGTLQTSQSITKSTKAKQLGSKVFAAPKEGQQVKAKRAVSGSFDSRFKNLAHQNNVQKQSRIEQAPDLAALNILDPKTGKIIRRNEEQHQSAGPSGTQPSGSASGSGQEASAYSSRSPPPNESAQPLREMRRPGPPKTASIVADVDKAYRRRSPPPVSWKDAPSTLDRPSEPQRTTSSSGDIHSAYYRRTPPPDGRQRSASPANSPKRPSVLEAPVYPTDGFHRRQTCKYWQRDECDKTAETCPYAHWVVERPQNNLHPKALTCFFWNEGQCRKTEGECEYAHSYTGLVADPPPGYRLPAEPAHKRPENLPSRDVLVPKHLTTCYYWRQPQGCNKPDSQCEYAHRDTGVYAGPPGTFKRRLSALGPTGATDIHAANADRIPAANRTFDPRLQESPLALHKSPVQTSVLPVQEQAQIAPPTRVVQKRPSIVACSTVRGAIMLSSAEDDDAVTISAKFEVPNEKTFKHLAGEDPVLRLDHLVVSGDFEKIMWNEELRAVEAATGGIAVEPSLTSQLETISEMCKVHAGGFLASVAGLESKVLIYPSNNETWRFLEVDDVAFPPGCLLHFRLFRNMSGISVTASPSNAVSAREELHYAASVGEKLARLDREQLLFVKPRSDQKLPPYDPIRAVFLLMPPGHHTDLVVYCEYFKGLKLKVYHSSTAGAWAYFCKKYLPKGPQKVGIVVVHPEVPLWQVPDLHNIAAAGTSLFSIGVDRTIAAYEEREPEFGCHGLFPLGRVTFITDDVFVYEPEKARKIVQTFNADQRRRPPGAKDDVRIATRPGLKEWIAELMLKNANVRDRHDKQDARWVKLYAAICELCPVEAEDPWNPPRLLPSSSLVSASPEELPGFQGLWEKDETAATDFMVNWFAGWAVYHAHRYRKFEVCHVPRTERFADAKQMSRDAVAVADPRGWTKKYQHIGVASPDAMLESMGSKKKES
ncbi:hypothetical protein AC579_10275 [Lecanosticta acicola]|uniref:Chromo domain-containing protein n=1 Tax=Lecanosticta acicola TaxID=111012 RepID=A0AAI9E878_9PEZI|nr:hypothetical protein AC579_10275 [Lecanosticta acicola]